MKLGKKWNVLCTDIVIGLWKAALPPLLQSQVVGLGRRQLSKTMSPSLRRRQSENGDGQVASIPTAAKGHGTNQPFVDATGMGTPVKWR